MTAIAVLATRLPFDPPIVIFRQAWMGQGTMTAQWPKRSLLSGVRKQYRTP
jgi:hypothetical protein